MGHYVKSVNFPGKPQYGLVRKNLITRLALIFQITGRLNFYKHQKKLVPGRAWWINPLDPVQHYLRWPLEIRVILQLLCGMKNTSKVLEIGSNYGRTAMSIFEVLEESGEYHGVDMSRSRIELASKLYGNFTSKFKFHYLDIFNSYYNPNGIVSQDEYILPFNDNYFDIVFSCSVVNHLLPPAIERNFLESSRVVKLDGYIMFSLFILDKYRGAGTSLNEYYQPNELDISGIFATRDLNKPEELVAYKLSYIQKLAKSHNLFIEKIIEGYWSHSKTDTAHELDLIIFRRG